MTTPTIPDPAAPAPGNPAGTGGATDFEALYKQVQASLAEAKKEAETWQGRFTGLQGKYQTDQKRWAEDSARVLELDTTLKTKTGDQEKTLLELEQVRKSLAEQTGKVDVVQTALDRLKLVTGEYPELLSFEHKGLLPAGTGDELKAKLTDFKAQLGDQIKGLYTGNVPPPPPAPAGKPSKEQLEKEMVAAGKANNWAKYEELRGQLYAA